MKIASVICEAQATINENLALIENYIKEASSNKAELILFSAGALNTQAFGYNPIIDRKMAFNLKNPLFKELSNFAKSSHIGLGIGFLEEKDGALYNSYIIFDDQGECKDVYHACNETWHQEGKESIYASGESVSAWVMNGLCYSILIGDDLDDEILCAMINALDVDICFIFKTRLKTVVDNQENCLKEIRNNQKNILSLNTNALIIKQYLKHYKTNEIISNGLIATINMKGIMEEVTEINKPTLYYFDI